MRCPSESWALVRLVPQLTVLPGEAWKVWFCYRKRVMGAGFEVSKPPAIPRALSVFRSMVQEVSP